MSKHYIVYKTTNTINGKFYIGCHETVNLEDGYYGSGKHLRRAIKKYGKHNFTREVLFVFDNHTEMFAKEKELVNEAFVNRTDTYNIGVGGKGGFYHLTPEQDRARLETYKKNFSREQNIANGKKTGPDNMKAHHVAGKIRYDTFRGKTHTEETKEKMRRSKNVGEANSQFGTMWITNGTENRKIKKDLDSIPEGWYKGRNMGR